MLLLTIVIIFWFSRAFYSVSKEKRLHSYNRELTLSLKGVLAILIMIHHLSYQWPETSLIAQQFGLWGALVCGMFFFVTGYGLQVSYLAKGDHYLQGFFKKRFLKLIYPILIATLFFETIKIAEGSFDMMLIWKNLKKGVPPLPYSWYVYVIVLFYSLFYIVFSISNKIKINILVFFIVTLIYMWIINEIHWGKYYSISIMALPLGMTFAVIEPQILPIIRKYPCRVIGAIGGVCVLLCLYALCGIYFHYVPAWGPLLYWFVPCFTVFACYGTGFLQHSGLNFLGKISYEIYLVHGTVIYFSCRLTENPYILTCIVIPSSIIAAHLLYMTCKKIKPSYG